MLPHHAIAPGPESIRTATSRRLSEARDEEVRDVTHAMSSTPMPAPSTCSSP